MAGVGDRWLESRWPDDREIIARVIDAAGRIRKRERQDLAGLIGKALGG